MRSEDAVRPPARLRVLLLAPEYPPVLVGGLGTYLEQLATALVRQGCDVDAFVYAVGHDSLVERDGVTLRFFSLDLDHTRGVDEVMRLVSRRLLELTIAHFAGCGTRPDIIHSHDWFGVHAVGALRRQFDAPVVTTIHFLHTPICSYYGDVPPPGVPEIEVRMCRESDRVIAVSHAMRQLAIDYHGADPDRVTTVWNGCHPAWKPSRTPPADAVPWRRLIPRDARVVLFAGRIVAMKGVDDLLRSAIAVLARVPDAFFVLAGEVHPHFRAVLRGIWQSHDVLKERVLFCGKQPRSELAHLYARASVAVVPAVYGPFGYAALEPMTLGVPVIASRIGGLAELVEEGVSGLLVPVEPRGGERQGANVTALADAQIRVLTDADLAARLADGGRRRAALFTSDEMAARTRDVYASALSARRRTMTSAVDYEDHAQLAPRA